MLTRQPLEGRSRKGGLRWGEMEGSCGFSHGVSAVLRDRMLVNSDKFETPVCGQCGFMAIKGHDAPSKDLVVPTPDYCRYCKTSDHCARIEIPWPMLLLVEELAAAHIRLRFHLRYVEDPVLGV